MESQQIVTETVSFGVGCMSLLPVDLIFSVENPEPSQWAKTLRTALETIPSISNISVNIPAVNHPGPSIEQIRSKYLLLDGRHTNLSLADLNGPSNGTVRFEITIPERMHSLAKFSSAKSLAPYERFEVTTNYRYYGPVTFVRAVGATAPLPRPSAIVILVREFLRQQLAKTDTDVRLLSIGPSPFHADFHANFEHATTADPLETLTYLWERLRGYDRVSYAFKIPPESAVDDAYREVIDTLSDPLSAYYYCVTLENNRGNDVNQINAEADDLIDLHQSTGALNWLKRTFRSSSKARDLQISISSARRRDADRARIFDDVLDGQSSETIPELFQKISGAFVSDPPKDFALANDIATTLENGRRVQFEVATLAAATMTGGLGGALVTILAR
ncbi:hypothetical protein [Tsukamurella paurometabola]|uniref:Uncharacterized protein n=1 Tax=Tsukamurella paurometabola TaxID=2061 RepID=A0ABS5NJI8_TSUPA|nr:hypothetical protein [Tsukamurella paurometabola]MBS4104462.1 hypothetical protein [Tsukamurella paurometabola]